MVAFAAFPLASAVKIFFPFAFVVAAPTSLLGCLLLCFLEVESSARFERSKRGSIYLVLLHLVLLHLQQFSRNTKSILVALGAETQVPELPDKTRGIIVKETAESDLKLLRVGLRDDVSGAGWGSKVCLDNVRSALRRANCR